VLAGRLVLASAVPDLLALLDDGDPRVRAAAASSLAQLGERPSDLDPARWSEWYGRELGWRQERAPRLLQAFASPGAGPAGEALRELFAHPLWRRELAREVAAGLAKAPRPVGVSACAMLEREALRDAIPGLVQALDARDVRLRKAAWSALKATSGETLPLDREAWQEFVHTGRL
jgi:HEAT repeat protein